MKLQNKFLILPQLFLIIIIIIGSMVISFFLVYGVFMQLEEDQVVRNNIRLENALLQEENRIATISKDWARWDDNYIFSHDLNEKFKEQNFYEESLIAIDFDFMVYYDKEGNILYIKQIDEDGNELYGGGEFSYVDINKEIFMMNKSDESAGGLLKIGNRLAVVAISPITMSDGSGDRDTYFMSGRYIDEDIVDKFGSVIYYPVDFYDFSSFNFSGLDKKTDYYINRSTDIVKSYFVVDDMNGEPVAVLSVNVYRDISKRGMTTVRIFLISSLILGAIVLGATFVLGRLLFKRILTQIKYLQNTAEEIMKENYDFKPLSSKDELGELSGSFKKMADQLKISKQEVQDINKELEQEVKMQTVIMNSKIEELEKTKRAVYNMIDDLRDANINLKQIDVAKTEFLNIVSHELKTPLTAMVAHLDVIDDMKDNLTESELHSLEAIRRNANQLRMLIGNILEMSRMESGKFELTKNKTNITKIINDVSDGLKILAKQKNIDLVIELGEIPELMVDDTRIREVINNLISNAIKFTEKGTITIKTEKMDDCVKVSVKDTGIGIPEEKIKNLFQKFYQVDASISRRYGGTGLGLSIVKKIVEEHGGKMIVESKVGVGSTFAFTLPLQ